MLLPTDAPVLWSRLLRLVERNPRRALPLVRHAWEQTSTSDECARGWVTYTLGWALLRAERFAEAQAHLRHAEQHFSRFKAEALLLHCRRALLLADLLSGIGPSLPALWEALAEDYERQQLVLDAARTRSLHVLHLVILGQVHQAQILGKRIAPLLEEQGTLYDRALLRRFMGMALGKIGALDQADAELESAANLFAVVPCPFEIAKCWLELGWNSQRRERFDIALSLLDRALTLFRRLDLPLNIAFCQKSLGAVAMRLGRYDQALAITIAAREQFVALGRRDHAAGCDLNIGNIAYYSGLFELALAAYRRAELIYIELDLQPSLLMSRRNQALVLRAMGNPTAALELLATLEAPCRALDNTLELAEIHLAQAAALHDIHLDEPALTLLQTAHTEFMLHDNRSAAAKCRLEQAWIEMGRDQLELATAHFATAGLELSDRPMHLWRVEHGLGRCAEMQGDLDQALVHYRRGCAYVAAQRRTLTSEHASSGFFRQAEQLYLDSLRLSVARVDAEMVLMLAEEQRALALERQLASGPFQLSAKQKGEYELQRSRLQTLLRNPTPIAELDEALLAHVAFLLAARHMVAQPDHNPVEPCTINSLRAQFNVAYATDWVALVYAECDDTLLAITIDACDISLACLPYDAELHALLDRACSPRFRRLTYLVNPLTNVSHHATAHESVLEALALRLIPQAVRQQLHPDRRLLVVPTGQLHMLPWAALSDNGRFLCQQAIIQLIPSLKLWPHLNSRPVSSDKALLLGCNQFAGRAPNLPGVVTELDLVERMWPGSITRLENETATRAVLLDLAASGALHQYQLLHLATHAQLFATKGVLAHLKLWDEDLLLDEVVRLNLAGALVILDVCEGALGEVLPGDELLSLSRAFLAAGARDVVASLWSVPDIGVQHVLRRMYDQLAHGKDVPTALAEAQRGLLAQPKDIAVECCTPFVWGGFVASGVGTILRPPTGGTKPAAA